MAQYVHPPTHTLHTHTHTHTHTGLQHMAIAPLTPDQEKLALAAAQLSATPTTTGDHHHHHQETHPHNDEGSGFSGGAYKGPVNKIKAFSGKGQTLSSSGTSDMGGASDVGGASESSARGAKRPKRRAEDVRWCSHVIFSKCSNLELAI